MYPEKSYRMTLLMDSTSGSQRNNYNSLLGMKWDDDWILYSPYNDPEKIRNTLSTNLWWDWGAHNNKFGMDNGTQGEFVELFIDGQYWGIYTLMKPLTSKHLNLTSDVDDPTKTEYFYRSISYVPTTTEMFQDAIEEFEIGRYELRYPKYLINSYEKWRPLDELMQTTVIPDINEFAERLQIQADINNIMDVWLFYAVTLAVDNSGKNNSYIAKLDGNNYVIYISPWDLDQTWGNSWNTEPHPHTSVCLSPNHEYSPGVLRYDRLLGEKSFDFAKSTQNRYDEIRTTLLSDENIYKIIGEYESQLFGSGAMLRNHDRWPDAEHADDISDILEFILDRMAYMDEYIAGLAD